MKNQPSTAQSQQTTFRELQDNYFARYEDLPLQSKRGECFEVEFVSDVYEEDGRKVIQRIIRDGTDRTGGNPIFILLDNKMPKVNGLEVLKIIKADEQLKLIPVVVLTSSRETPDLHEFMKAVRQLGVFWAAINEPPPDTEKEKSPPPGGAGGFSGKTEAA